MDDTSYNIEEAYERHEYLTRESMIDYVIKHMDSLHYAALHSIFSAAYYAISHGHYNKPTDTEQE